MSPICSGGIAVAGQDVVASGGVEVLMETTVLWAGTDDIDKVGISSGYEPGVLRRPNTLKERCFVYRYPI